MQSYTVKWHVNYMCIYLYNVKFTILELFLWAVHDFLAHLSKDSSEFWVFE